MQEQVQLTTFDDDKAAILERPPGETQLSGKATTQFADAIDHSVVSFMERPQLIAQTQWKSSQTRGSRLFETPVKPLFVPDIALTSMIRNKLDGFSSFRATAVFRLQINAQPFQQGRLLLAAIPMPTLISPRDEYMASHISLLQAVNHVQIDINKQSEVTLRIPFISPFSAYDVIHGQYPWARIVVAVYSDLRQVEQVDLDVLLWSSFENIELGAPTSAYVMQQSGVVPTAPSNPQVAQTRQSEQSPGSSMLSGLADAAMSAIPGGGAISSIANGIGSLFGFSKPNQEEKGCVIVQRPSQYFGNVDGIDQSHVLALDRLNAIDEFPGLGGTDMDECSMEYLTKIPQYISAYTFNKCNKFGDVLWKTFVAPTYYLPGSFKINATRYNASPLNKPVYESTNISQPTILNYVCSPFMYWTGSLVYTFRFMKTDFHSGRIEIAYHPYTQVVSGDRYDYVYRLVVDLRESTEISFTVPYISPTPWKAIKTFDPLGTIVPPWSEIGAFTTGTLTVRALTPLITSNPVANNCIECVVEMRAGSDFKVQGPTKASFYPVTLVRDTTENRVVQQAGEVFSLAGTQETRTSALSGFEPPSITNNASDIQTDDTQKLCAGEIFGNFRSLTRRFSFVDTRLPTGKRIWTIRPPYYLRPPQISLTSVEAPSAAEGIVWTDKKSLQAQLVYQCSPLCFVSAMYAFYRGSMRTKVYSNPLDTNREPNLVAARVSSVQYFGEDNVNDTFGKYLMPYMSPVGFEQPNQKQLAEYQIPFYSPCLMSVHWDYRSLSYFDQSQATLEVSTTASSNFPGVHLAVAAGDDMNFHGFIGVPFCISTSTFTDYFTTGQKTEGSSTETVYAYNWKTDFSVDPSYVLSQRPYLGKDYQIGGASFGSPFVTIKDLSIVYTDKPCPATPITTCPAAPGVTKVTYSAMGRYH